MANEFRKDFVSGEWVLIASNRAKRPRDNQRARLYQTVDGCPFDGARLKEQEIIARYPFGTMVMHNKFPALQSGVCGDVVMAGPYETFPAMGFHELVVTADHEKHFANFSSEEGAEVFRAYRDRYLEMAKSSCGDYISIVHNHGRSAGASVSHNHSQIITAPFVPPAVARSIVNSAAYLTKTGKPIHIELIAWELSQQSRMVFENELFVAFCPFASKAAYEVRIFPKAHRSRFEASSDEELVACAEAMTAVLKAMCVALDDVDYNFYIHTSPVSAVANTDSDAYHWHIEILPRIPVAAGFELSTAVYINPFDPDVCAGELREA